MLMVFRKRSNLSEFGPALVTKANATASCHQMNEFSDCRLIGIILKISCDV